MDPEFLAILACPMCKGKLEYQPAQKRFVCRAEHIAFPITDDGIPVLLAEEGVPVESENDSAHSQKDGMEKDGG